MLPKFFKPLFVGFLCTLLCVGCVRPTTDREESDSAESEHVHSYTAAVVSPTCTEAGYTRHDCPCGDSYTDTAVPAVGHTLGEWSTVREPSVAEEGLREQVCSVCGACNRETIARIVDLDALGKDTADAINAIRAEAGLSALAYRSDLQAAADLRAEELIVEFSNTRPDGSEWDTVQESAGVAFSSPYGTIVFSGVGDVAMLAEYMKSNPEFDAYLLSTDYAGLAVGVSEAEGTYYWAVLFFGPTERNIDGFAEEIFRLVNEERLAAGLPALTYCTELQNGADIRAEEMLTKYDHERPNGSSCFTVYAETGVSYRGAGENIAYGQKTPEAVMAAWMDSPGHRANILGEFTGIAVSISQNNGIIYWVQLFIAQ